MRCLEMLRRSNQEFKQTVLMITHNPEAAAIGDRILHMRDGRLVGNRRASHPMTTWVLFAGLPGTGKSTLARALAERLHAAVLDKDCVRGALFPGALTDYSAEQDQLCMRAILEAAAYLTERRRVDYIFFDGRTFSTRAQIEEVLLAAAKRVRAGVFFM